MNRAKCIIVLIGIIFANISCVITQKDYTSSLSGEGSIVNSTIAVTDIEDYRDIMERSNFPDADIQFMQLIENELVRFNVNVVTRTEIDSVLDEQEVQLTGLTDDVVSIGSISKADYVIVAKLYNYGWIDTAFSIQIIDATTGNIYFGASYSDNEPLWVPLFLSSYHPNNQMRKAMSKIFDDLYGKIHH